MPPLRQVYETNKYHVPPAATAAYVLAFQIFVRDFVGSRFVIAFEERPVDLRCVPSLTEDPHLANLFAQLSTRHL